MKLLLAEDQTMVRTALASLLRLESDYQVEEAVDGAQAKAMLEAEHYDILLTDIEMPHMTGLELLQWAKQHQPHLLTVVITTFNRSGYVKRAIAEGVNGFLLKDAPIEVLVESLRQIQNGHQVISNELLLQALDDRDPLTDKERKALRLAGEGLSTAAIADALFIAEGTARNYLSEAMSKLHAHNRTEASRSARQKGWLQQLLAKRRRLTVHRALAYQRPINKQKPELMNQNVRLSSGNIGINLTKETPRIKNILAMRISANFVKGKRFIAPAPDSPNEQALRRNNIWPQQEGIYY